MYIHTHLTCTTMYIHICVIWNEGVGLRLHVGLVVTAELLGTAVAEVCLYYVVCRCVC